MIVNDNKIVIDDSLSCTDPNKALSARQGTIIRDNLLTLANTLSMDISNNRADINELKSRNMLLVVEQGDNYVKYSNGLMEQHFTVTGTRANVVSFSFPQPFVSTPVVHRNILISTNGTAQQLRGWNIYSISTTGFDMYTPDISSAETSMISAYGYWK